MEEKRIFERKGISLNSLERDSSLGNWFYQMVQKKASELSLLDIYHMLRQEMFLDVAMPIAREMIQKDQLCGEMWDGQIMELMDDILKKHPEWKDMSCAVDNFDLHDQSNR